MSANRVIDIAGKEWFEPGHPANVQVAGAMVAVPVDIQYIDVPVTNPLPVQQAGTKQYQYSTLTVANQIAITDINTHPYDGTNVWTGATTAIPNWNNYNRHALMLLTTLNQPITIYLLTKLRGVIQSTSVFDTLYAGSGGNTIQSVTVAGGQFQPTLITDVELPALKGIQFADVSISVKCATAPTSGNFSIAVVMWAE